MPVSAHMQAVVECLEGVQRDDQSSASSFLKSYFQNHRAIGSRDRRAITDDVYAILRLWGGWQAVFPDLTPHQAVYHYMEQTVLPPLSEKGSLEVAPLQGRFDSDFWKAMGEEAPFDLRINPLKTTRDKAWYRLLKQYSDMTLTPWSPLGLRLPKKQAPEGLLKQMLEDGSLEVQDEGSQLVGLLCDAQPHMRVWDACAGAGGKTLLLGACMNNTGCLVASDADLRRLMKAQPRLERAGLYRVQYQALQHVRQTFDRVLVDAPCSGTGTWRRHPELAMRFSMPDAARSIEALQNASEHVKQGGLLIYATCSILHEENEDVIQSFLTKNQHFLLEDIASVWHRVLCAPCPVTTPWLQLTPLDHYTDGFFVAVMRRQQASKK